MAHPHQETVTKLAEFRRATCFPVQVQAHADSLLTAILALLFPHFSANLSCDEANLFDEVEFVKNSLNELHDALRGGPFLGAERFIDQLPNIHQSLLLDGRAIVQGDPASANLNEVILAYPGFYATAVYRVSHALHGQKFPLLPRLLSEIAHRRTGIDIHPGAEIGRSFFIDHGTGVVIGETARIGHGVKLYQGVTLGALVVNKQLANVRRHPTLEDNVVIYANATILGGETTIGHDSIVGGNAWITESVPAFSLVGRNSDVRPRKPGEMPDLEFYI